MTKKEIRKIAKESILAGKTKQETYNELEGIVGIPSEKLAKIIQLIPSLEIREKYKVLNILFIVLISITILYKIFFGVELIIEFGIKLFPVLFILPLINILLLRGVLKYNYLSYILTAVLTILGILRTKKDAIEEAGSLIVIDLAIAAALIILGFYLGAKFYKGYTVYKVMEQDENGERKQKSVIKFEE